MPVEIRRAAPGDGAALQPLIAEHAAYERGAASCTAAQLRDALAGSSPVLVAWLAECDGEPVGYATATVDVSTWAGRKFLHLDCLFVREENRGEAIGKRLLHTARAFAKRQGLTELQWQTPAWNDRAIRFYVREGATMEPKQRFKWLVPDARVK